MALKSKLRSARWLIPLATALLLAALVAIPSSGTALAQSPPGNELTLVKRRPGLRGAQEGAASFVARPHLRPGDRRPLLRRPGRRHRRLDKRHVQGQGRREEAKRTAGNTRGSTPTLTSTPTPTSTATGRTCLVMLAVRRGRQARGEFYAVVPHPRTRTHLGQDSERPQPGALGEGLRRLGDRGSPRDPLRSG